MNIITYLLFFFVMIITHTANQIITTVTQSGIYNFFFNRNALSKENAISIGDVDFLAMGISFGKKKNNQFLFGTLERFGVMPFEGKYWLDLEIYEQKVRAMHQGTTKSILFLGIVAMVTLLGLFVTGLIFDINFFN